MPIRPVDPNYSKKAALLPERNSERPRIRRRPDSDAEMQPAASPSDRPPLDPNRNPDGSYKVGRGKTPQHTRWKPGQSGNPNGPKKVKVDVDDIVINLMEEPITLTSSKGRKVKMTQGTALFRKLYEWAIKGDYKTAKDLIDRYAGAKARRSAAGSSDDGLSAAERELLEFFLRRFRGDDDEPDFVPA